jgi:uncharacterized protein YwqG
MGIFDRLFGKKDKGSAGSAGGGPPPTDAAADGGRSGLEAALAKLAAHKRSAWKPYVEEGPGAPGGSRFGGLPAAGAEWPVCGQSGKPLTLFAQIASEHLPEELGRPFGEGLLQVFCATHDGGDDTWAAFSETHCLRVVPATDEVLPAPDGVEVFPVKAIVGWEEQADYPHYEDLMELDHELDDDEDEVVAEAGYPVPGDKLGGWPMWIQGAEYPDCRQCGARMELLLQLDSEDQLPWMWGDVGCAHVTVCPEHPDELALAWACH